LAAKAAQDLRRALRLDLFVAFFLISAVPLISREGSSITRAGAALAIAAGAMAIYYSLRLRFDAAAFERWAASADIEAEMRAFDAQLQARFPGRGFPPRALSERIAGAMRLRRVRAWFCVAQGLAILVALAFR
jgi:hypothetical protein